MHIGILKADETPNELLGKHGRYEDFYIALLSDYGFSFSVYPVFEGTFPASTGEADGWLVTGSRHSAVSDAEWILSLKQFIRDSHRGGVLLVGICFGHQVIASALGGTVEASKDGWHVGPVIHTRIADGAKQNALVWHQDKVATRPPGAQVLGYSESCEYAILQYDDTILSFQCHPELSAAYVQDLLSLDHIDVPDEMRARVAEARADTLQASELAAEIADFFGSSADLRTGQHELKYSQSR